jgi:cytochrome c553
MLDNNTCLCNGNNCPKKGFLRKRLISIDMITTRKISTLLLLFCISLSTALSQSEPGNIRAGENLFHKTTNEDGLSCVYCHYFIEPDTINWNPSAPDLASKYDTYVIDGIEEYFENPKGDVIKKAHAGYSLNADEQKDVIAYLSSLDTKPASPKKPFKIRLALFIGMFILLFLIRLEKKKLRKIPLNVRRLLVLATWIIICVIIAQDAIALGRSENYAPVQPIKFSHLIHSTDNQIECNYCHSGVIKGKNAGIPPISLCMNCHKHVLEGTKTGFFEINKITQAMEDSIPIRWVRVHNLPDYTYFNHMQHVKIAEIDCTICHGDVKSMNIVKQTEDLSMGWCIDCHDSKAVDFSNEYYKTYYPVYYDSLQTGKIDSVMVSDIGGRDCSKCHY